MKKCFLFAFSFLLVLGTGRAEAAYLPPKVQESFPKLIETGFTPYFEEQELLRRIDSRQVEEEHKADFKVPMACYSTIDYTLERSFEEVHWDYHTLMINVFGDAFEISRFETEKMIGQDSEYGSFIPKDTKWTFKGKFLEKTQRAQKELGFESICPELQEDDRHFASDSLPKDMYSSCRVTETVLNEWCGYRLYLWGKLRDKSLLVPFEKSKLSYEIGTPDENLPPQLPEVPTPKYANNVKQFRTLQIEHEYEKTQETLYQMIEFYRIYEQQHRKHIWYQHIKKSLLSISSKLHAFRKAYYKFPEKFINASAKRCR